MRDVKEQIEAFHEAQQAEADEQAQLADTNDARRLLAAQPRQTRQEKYAAKQDAGRGDMEAGAQPASRTRRQHTSWRRVSRPGRTTAQASTHTAAPSEQINYRRKASHQASGTNADAAPDTRIAHKRSVRSHWASA